MTTTKPKVTPQGEKLRRDFGIMTPQELANMLEISPYTLQGWARRQPPEGPVFIYLGSKTYYRKEDVMSWIDDGLIRADFAKQAAKP